MCVLQWNVNGLAAQTRADKIELLKKIDADIISLCETHLKDNDNNSDIFGHEYQCFFHNRSLQNINARRTSGGVAVLVKKILFNEYHISVIDRVFDGILALCFTDKISNYEFIIISAYLPPENSAWGQNSSSFFSHILTLMYQYSHADAVYFMGDLNARIGGKQDYNENFDTAISPRVFLDKVSNKHGDTFIEFLKDSRCCVVNGRINASDDNYTFIDPNRGSSVVDWLVVPHDCLKTINSFKIHVVSDFGQSLTGRRLSDHSLIEFRFCPHYDKHVTSVDQLRDDTVLGDCIEPPNLQNYFRRYDVRSVPPNFMQSTFCREAVLNCISGIEQSRETQRDIDNVYESVCSIYYREMKNFFKCKQLSPGSKQRSKRKPKPFWNEQLTQLWEALRIAERKYLKAKQSTVERRNYQQSFKSKQNEFDKLYKKLKRKYERQKRIDIETLNTENPREFWREVKNLGPRKIIEIPTSVYSDSGSITNNISDVLQKWKTDFQSLLNPSLDNNSYDARFYNEVLQDLHDTSNRPNNLYPELDSDFTKEEVKKVIGNAKQGKSVGVEGIPNEVLKNILSIDLLYSLFNKVFQSGCVPSLWRLGIIKPLPKGSLTDPHIPLQYRGIALLSTIYKIYTSLLNSRLLGVAESHKIYDEEQNGFRRGRSCQDHIYSLTTIIRHRLASKLPVFACFIDMEKAFDRVDRDLLLYKLRFLGITGKFYEALSNIYENCKNCVNLNGYVTDWFQSDLGVKQGDVISPTLFGLFLNDLICQVKEINGGISIGQEKVSILAYADDIIILGSSENELQAALNCISNWANKWRMNINCSKSSVVHFRRKITPQTGYNFTFGGLALDKVNKYKYLGVMLHENLDYSVIANTLADAGGRALGSVINKYKKISGLGFYTYSKLYKSCVNPVLNYSAEVWGYKDFQSINKVQNRAIRSFLGVNNFTSNLAIQGDIGWTSPKANRHLAMIRYFNRIVGMDEERLPRKIFNWEKSLKTHGWGHEVLQILSAVNLANNYTNNIACDLNLVWSELFRKESQEWKNKVEASRKLRTYKIFKEGVETEPYVFCILNRGYRSVVARLRAGVLPLEIETGRWSAIPAEHRYCRLCNNGCVEDEIHFVFNCEIYIPERVRLFENVEHLVPGFMEKDLNGKLQVLMSKEVINIFAKFLFIIFNKRQSTIYT